jgi:formylglycine-generating enzyme required for sulfatase activity
VADIFISYKREDKATVEQIVSRLKDEGYSVWWDAILEGGEDFGSSIAKEIDAAKCVIVIWSKTSVGSKWVYAEATEADSQGKLVPVTVEPCRVRPPFNVLHTFELLDGAGGQNASAWKALFDRVRAFGAVPADGTESPQAVSGATEMPGDGTYAFVRLPAGSCRHHGDSASVGNSGAVIEIAYDFAIGKYPVTVTDWETAIDQGLAVNPPRPAGSATGNAPVVNVSWDDATRYAEWLSQRLGKTVRLPSEAEWEYACRGDRATTFSFGETLTERQACCRISNGSVQAQPKGPAPVGSYPPNHFGLHDMHGNVWEWTMDCWRPSLVGDRVTGAPMLEGDFQARVIRGGSWAHPAETAGCSSRGHAQRDSRNQFTGFRLVLECEQQPTAQP